MKRRLITLICAGLLGLAGPLATAPVAHAALLDVTCAGTNSMDITPGLLFGPQTVFITGTKTFSTCVSTDPTLTSGITVAAGTVVRTCNLSAAPHPGSAVITWNNSQTSTFSYTATTTYSLGQNVTTFNGSITAGEFTGDAGLMVSTAFANPLQCLFPPGVTHMDGVVTLEITSLP